MIVARRGDALAIRRPGHRAYAAGMTTMGEELTLRCGIPYLDRAITIAQSDIPTIWRPCQRMRHTARSTIGEDHILRVCISYARYDPRLPRRYAARRATMLHQTSQQHGYDR